MIDDSFKDLGIVEDTYPFKGIVIFHGIIGMGESVIIFFTLRV